MIKVFISYSSAEEDLAKYLADWIQKEFKDMKCFCSGRPSDLPPGIEWRRKIIKEAKRADCCLLLFSTDSSSNEWIQFEAGIVTGAGDYENLVPVLYGGMNVNSIPPTVRDLQALILSEPASFDAFISKRFLSGRPPNISQTYQNFLKHIDSKILRLLKFGKFGLLASQNVTTESLLPTSLDKNNTKILLHRIKDNGHFVGIRTVIIPRRMGRTVHWKFGITLGKSNATGNLVRFFQFHCGCHEGINTWSVYDSENPQVPINIPAKLHVDGLCTLQLWLSDDGRLVGCVGIDNDGKRTVIPNDLGENLWRIKNSEWTDVAISAWTDFEIAPYKVDIQSLEIDRIHKST